MIGDPPKPVATGLASLATSSSDENDDSPQSKDEENVNSAAISETSEVVKSPGPESPTARADEGREILEGATADDDSVEAVGKEEAAEHDRDMMDENDGDDATEEEGSIVEVDISQPTKVTTMLQKILSFGVQGGQVILNTGADPNTKESPTILSISTAAKTGPSASQPTIIHNGRMVCYFLPQGIVTFRKG